MNEVREFFTNTFFTVVIAVSATLAVVSYFLIINEHFIDYFKRRFMDQKITGLKNHFILCGFGRVGQRVALELANEKTPFVIIERDKAKLALADEKKWLYLLGDSATDESILQKAKIKEAKGIIIAVGDDANSVFIAVSAKAINPNLFIVARASTPEAEEKLKKLGVNRVAMPYQIGGYHMATMALRPSVVDFLDVMVDSKHNELQVEEMEIAPKSKIINEKLETHLSRDKTGAVVLAIKKPDGNSVINPNAETIIAANDRLILMGSKNQLNQIGETIK